LKLQLFEHDAVVVREPRNKVHGSGGKRGVVGLAPSSATLKRLVMWLNNSDPSMKFMITLTLSKEIAFMSADNIQRAFKNYLQSLRDRDLKYLWIREHHKSGAPHFHVFVEDFDSETGAKTWDREASLNESIRWANICQRVFRAHLSSEEATKMRRVSCRVEYLRNAAGHYAAKEGGKRFQKVAPEAWGGKTWWGKSRGLLLEPLDTVEISDRHARACTVNGFRVLYKIQWGATSLVAEIEEAQAEKLEAGLIPHTLRPLKVVTEVPF